MKHTNKIILAAFVLSASLAAPVAAGSFEEGRTAYNRGDYQTALRLWRLLADEGIATAQYNLGFMYAKGQGVDEDYAEAVKWFHEAADQGFATAQATLGLIYYEGQGVPQDYVQAHMWFNLAAGQGDEHAVWNRTVVTKLMTPAQIAEAQKLAREWKPK